MPHATRMPSQFGFANRHRQRAGTIILMTAFLMAMLVAAAAFTIDIAYMHSVRSELQHGTDAAARAASHTIGNTEELDAARDVAIYIAGENTVAGESFILEDEDIVFGKSVLSADGSFTFEEVGSPKNSVRIRGRRTEASASGAVSLFLGKLLGQSHFHPELFSTATRIDRDICIVVDRSGSMAWDESGISWRYPGDLQNNSWQVNYATPPHPTGSRWAGLVEAIHEFEGAITETVEEELISLVSYSDAYTYQGISAATVTTHCELTADPNVILNKISEIGEEAIIGGTNISAGVNNAIATLTNSSTNRSHAFKLIILMTDGVWNSGADPAVTAQAAADLGIIVHTITFSDAANQADMIEVAELTGGKHYHAPTRDELKEAFADIAYSVPVVLIH
ncbi:MAG: VWA domain-containing protein [Pirellulaceae bacterium]|nr:VWA domain-containing protein [Pirellulaceae bacterium]